MRMLILSRFVDDVGDVGESLSWKISVIVFILF